jgi:hypothetical protein
MSANAAVLVKVKFYESANGTCDLAKRDHKIVDPAVFKNAT